MEKTKYILVLFIVFTLGILICGIVTFIIYYQNNNFNNKNIVISNYLKNNTLKDNLEIRTNFNFFLGEVKQIYKSTSETITFENLVDNDFQDLFEMNPKGFINNFCEGKKVSDSVDSAKIISIDSIEICKVVERNQNITVYYFIYKDIYLNKITINSIQNNDDLITNIIKQLDLKKVSDLKNEFSNVNLYNLK